MSSRCEDEGEDGNEDEFKVDAPNLEIYQVKSRQEPLGQSGQVDLERCCDSSSDRLALEARC